MSTVDIDKVLEDWGNCAHAAKQAKDRTEWNARKAEAKATLKAELLAKMPKKITPLKINAHEDEPVSVRIARCDAYNEAITEITKIVNEL